VVSQENSCEKRHWQVHGRPLCLVISSYCSCFYTSPSYSDPCVSHQSLHALSTVSEQLLTMLDFWSLIVKLLIYSLQYTDRKQNPQCIRQTGDDKRRIDSMHRASMPLQAVVLPDDRISRLSDIARMSHWNLGNCCHYSCQMAVWIRHVTFLSLNVRRIWQSTWLHGEGNHSGPFILMESGTVLVGPPWALLLLS